MSKTSFHSFNFLGISKLTFPVPKKEIKTLNHLEIEDQVIVGKMFIAAKKLAKELNIDKNGYRTVFNCNDHGGQTVFHIHLHLLGGRQLAWPPG